MEEVYVRVLPHRAAGGFNSDQDIIQLPVAIILNLFAYGNVFVPACLVGLDILKR